MYNTFEKLPPGWQRQVRQLRKDCKTYRLRLREAEERIAELEARSQ